jgi:hypothetical protein
VPEANRQAPEDRPDGETRSSFRFSLNLGNRPADGAPAELERLLEEANRQLAASPGSTGSVSGSETSLEFKDGMLRVVSGDKEQFSYDFVSSASRGQALDPLPLIAKIRRWINLAVTALSLAIPIGLVALGIATSQSFETIFYMGLFGLIIGAMLMSSLRVKRSPVEDLLPLLLEKGPLRKGAGTDSTSPDAHSSQDRLS